MHYHGCLNLTICENAVTECCSMVLYILRGVQYEEGEETKNPSG